ncbi:hypothetical protein KP509_34G026500 [Ceratopteris richardii]|nr:hypothetical protein KP509_34G026500 [Ceratopteris richardii]
MFEIFFEDDKGERSLVWQNSWAFTTRVIGVMVMIHGDDKGLVLPPKVATVQVVIIPVPYKNVDFNQMLDACNEVSQKLESAGLRVKQDTRDNYPPGWKYSDWELKGVPLRIEIGPKDIENKQVRMVRRDNFEKEDVPLEKVAQRAADLLDEIQANLFKKAKEVRDLCIKKVFTWEDFIEALNDKKMVLAPWCDDVEVEEDVKARTKGDTGAAKTLCMPFEQPDLPDGTVCFASGKPAKRWALWGRSY